MARTPEPPDLERRIPRQQRALESCEAIFEATAQLLQKGGSGALSTNRIAERAGVSIGTLYQYFPNKQAVLLALGRRDIDQARAMLLAALAEAPLRGEPAGPAGLHALLQGFAARPAPVLGETVFRQELQDELAALVTTAADALAGPLPAERRFVLTRALLGVLRAAALEPAPPEPALLEREMLALAERYLGSRN